MSSYDHEEDIDEHVYDHNEYQNDQSQSNNQQQNNQPKSDPELQYDNPNHKNRKYKQKQNIGHSHRSNQQQSDSHDKIHSNRQSGNSSDNQSQQSSPSEEIQLTQQTKLENDILQLAADLEQSTPYQNLLTMELFDRVKDLQYACRSKSGEDLVTLRIQQLVVNKILVLTYNKSQYRLILSHYRLGQAYLVNQCIQQSIEHISVALHKIQKLFEAIPEARLLQTQMQSQLAKALICKENYQDAIQLLTTSIREDNRLKQIRKIQTDEAEDKNTKTLLLLSQCYSKISNHEQALRVIDEVIDITKRKKMAKEQYAFALVEKAKILSLQKKISQAITFQEQAIDTLMEENYSKPEEVAELYTVLSNYYQEINNVENSLTCIQKVKTLYQELYSGEDKRVIKARRKIATFLLKSERFKQAINELLEVLELEQKVFGENSLQTARTLKLLGAVYISMEVADARAYLKRAMNIFQFHGNKKQVQQIRDKLKLLYHDHQTDGKDIKLVGSQHQI